MSKSEGLKIVIKFDDAIVSDASGNEQAFTVKVNEYDFVPGGTLVEKIKKVESVEVYTSSESGNTDIGGEFVFATPAHSLDGYIKVQAKGYKPKIIHVDDLHQNQQIQLEEIGELPVISDLVVHLDASKSETIFSYEDPIRSINDLVLWLNSEEGIDYE